MHIWHCSLFSVCYCLEILITGRNSQRGGGAQQSNRAIHLVRCSSERLSNWADTATCRTCHTQKNMHCMLRCVCTTNSIHCIRIFIYRYACSMGATQRSPCTCNQIDAHRRQSPLRVPRIWAYAPDMPSWPSRWRGKVGATTDPVPLIMLQLIHSGSQQLWVDAKRFV